MVFDIPQAAVVRTAALTAVGFTFPPRVGESMSDATDDLRDAFEAEGYEVGEVSTNRDRVRVALMAEGAEADTLRAIVHDAVGDDDVMGLNVTTENVEGQDVVQTVVSFRDRS
jgi:hypothetical protein